MELIIQQYVLGLDVQVHNSLLAIMVQICQASSSSSCDTKPCLPIQKFWWLWVIHEQPLIKRAIHLFKIKSAESDVVQQGFSNTTESDKTRGFHHHLGPKCWPISAHHPLRKGYIKIPSKWIVVLNLRLKAETGNTTRETSLCFTLPIVWGAANHQLQLWTALRSCQETDSRSLGYLPCTHILISGVLQPSKIHAAEQDWCDGCCQWWRLLSGTLYHLDLRFAVFSQPLLCHQEEHLRTLPQTHPLQALSWNPKLPYTNHCRCTYYNHQLPLLIRKKLHSSEFSGRSFHVQDCTFAKKWVTGYSLYSLERHKDTHTNKLKVYVITEVKKVKIKPKSLKTLESTISTLKACREKFEQEFADNKDNGVGTELKSDELFLKRWRTLQLLLVSDISGKRREIDDSQRTKKNTPVTRIPNRHAELLYWILSIRHAWEGNLHRRDGYDRTWEAGQAKHPGRRSLLPLLHSLPVSQRWSCQVLLVRTHLPCP